MRIRSTLLVAACCLASLAAAASANTAAHRSEDAVIRTAAIRLAAVQNTQTGRAVRVKSKAKVKRGDTWLNPQPEPPRPAHPNWLNPQPEPPVPPVSRKPKGKQITTY